MPEDLLMIGPLDTPVLEALERDFTVHKLWEGERGAVLAAAKDARYVATDGHFGCAPEIMDALPKLEVVSSYGVGVDAIDIDDASRRGVRVTNTPDVLTDCAAELALALMLALCRRIPQGDRYIRTGRWAEEGPFMLTDELTGKRAGILGLGRVGKEIATRLQAFRMQVVYHGRSEQEHQPYTYYADLEEMARDVDWLVVIAPGSASTKGIVSRKVMEALGPDGRLVNVARGILVDEDALVELLASGALGAAALDVFVDEPNVPAALMEMDNVVLSPHQGSATVKTRAQMGKLVVDNLLAHAAGRPLLTPVN